VCLTYLQKGQSFSFPRLLACFSACGTPPSTRGVLLQAVNVYGRRHNSLLIRTRYFTPNCGGSIGSKRLLARGLPPPRGIPFLDFANYLVLLPLLDADGGNPRQVPGQDVYEDRGDQPRREPCGLAEDALSAVGEAFLLPLDVILGLIFFSERNESLQLRVKHDSGQETER